jgi:hypothetical protein
MQRIFRRRSIVPTYVLDHPVATSEAARRFFGQLLDRGECEVGAHLHPWVNPPDEEEVSAANSYPGNLPPALERRKIEVLTEAVETALGVRPRVYKAGRYGLGAATPATVAALGYEVDASVAPHSSFATDGGPDFRGWPDEPFWFGPERQILEAPVTRGFAGRAAVAGPALHAFTEIALGRRLRLGGLAARLGLFERIALSPEGSSLDELKRLTRALVAGGTRLLSFCYHSPSLSPGNTPYVRSGEELRRFLDTASSYFDFFAEEIGGRFVTLSEARRIVGGEARAGAGPAAR